MSGVSWIEVVIWCTKNGSKKNVELQSFSNFQNAKKNMQPPRERAGLSWVETRWAESHGLRKQPLA